MGYLHRGMHAGYHNRFLEKIPKDATELTSTKPLSSATDPIGAWAYVHTNMLK